MSPGYVQAIVAALVFLVNLFWAASNARAKGEIDARIADLKIWLGEKIDSLKEDLDSHYANREAFNQHRESVNERLRRLESIR
jgi:hypothetical protein